MGLIDDAIARSEARVHEPKRIDYARMSRVHPLQKAALTRAKRKGAEAVAQACKAAVAEWNEIGAWPDDWNTWALALNDAVAAEYGYGAVPVMLEDL